MRLVWLVLVMLLVGCDDEQLDPARDAGNDGGCGALPFEATCISSPTWSTSTRCTSNSFVCTEAGWACASGELRRGARQCTADCAAYVQSHPACQCIAGDSFGYEVATSCAFDAGTD